jgi:hypothetical protein
MSTPSVPTGEKKAGNTALRMNRCQRSLRRGSGKGLRSPDVTCLKIFWAIIRVRPAQRVLDPMPICVEPGLDVPTTIVERNEDETKPMTCRPTQPEAMRFGDHRHRHGDRVRRRNRQPDDRRHGRGRSPDRKLWPDHLDSASPATRLPRSTNSSLPRTLAVRKSFFLIHNRGRVNLKGITNHITRCTKKDRGKHDGQ